MLHLKGQQRVSGGWGRGQARGGQRTLKPSFRKHSLWASMNLAQSDSSPWVM